MLSRAEIERTLLEAIAAFNEERPADERIAVSSESSLYGDGGPLDSIGLIDLVLAVENRLRQSSGESVALFDSRLLSGASNPFRSVASLVSFIESQLQTPKTP